MLRGEGEEFVGQASIRRNGELKFFCRVSVENNPDLSVTSNTAKVKVKTREAVVSPFTRQLLPSCLFCSLDHSGARTYQGCDWQSRLAPLPG